MTWNVLCKGIMVRNMSFKVIDELFIQHLKQKSVLDTIRRTTILPRLSLIHTLRRFVHNHVSSDISRSEARYVLLLPIDLQKQNSADGVAENICLFHITTIITTCIYSISRPRPCSSLWTTTTIIIFKNILFAS